MISLYKFIPEIKIRPQNTPQTNEELEKFIIKNYEEFKEFWNNGEGNNYQAYIDNESDISIGDLEDFVDYTGDNIYTVVNINPTVNDIGDIYSDNGNLILSLKPYKDFFDLKFKDIKIYFYPITY